MIYNSTCVVKATVEEMYRGEFEVGSTKFTLDIEDTSGTFSSDFPGLFFRKQENM